MLEYKRSTTASRRAEKKPQKFIHVSAEIKEIPHSLIKGATLKVPSIGVTYRKPKNEKGNHQQQ